MKIDVCRLLDHHPHLWVDWQRQYRSAQGTEDSNKKLSVERANAVRNYLIEKGIGQGRITIIGYGRTKPALYEVSPGDINTKEAKANMRVLFEIIVK